MCTVELAGTVAGVTVGEGVAPVGGGGVYVDWGLWFGSVGSVVVVIVVVVVIDLDDGGGGDGGIVDVLIDLARMAEERIVMLGKGRF